MGITTTTKINLRNKRIEMMILLCFAFVMAATAQKGYKQVLRETDPQFFRTEEARRIGDQLHQTF